MPELGEIFVVGLNGSCHERTAGTTMPVYQLRDGRYSAHLVPAPNEPRYTEEEMIEWERAGNWTRTNRRWSAIDDAVICFVHIDWLRANIENGMSGTILGQPFSYDQKAKAWIAYLPIATAAAALRRLGLELFHAAYGYLKTAPARTFALAKNALFCFDRGELFLQLVHALILATAAEEQKTILVQSVEREMGPELTKKIQSLAEIFKL
jgi:hypothetical protein